MFSDKRTGTSQESQRKRLCDPSTEARPLVVKAPHAVGQGSKQDISTDLCGGVALRLEEQLLTLIATLEFVTASNLATITMEEEASIGEILERMKEDKLVDRTWMPDESVEKGCWVYFLTTRGARVASRLLKESVRRPRVDERISLLLYHRTAISQAVAGLAAGLGYARLQVCRLGLRLRTTLKDSALKSIYFPDAYLAFSVQKAESTFVRHLFLEVDRGTERSAQLKSKFHSLNSYYLQDHRRLFHTDRLVVAMTTPNENRSREIGKLVREANCRVCVLVALQSQVSRGDRALSSWTDCITGQSRHLLEAPQEPSQG